MIEVLVRGEGVEHLFSKYVGVLGVLGREDYFIFIGGDSKFSGEGGFSNVLVVERDGFVYPVYLRVVCC